MQQLIDLHAMLDQLDVRDDHLCEERGLRATQELLREALLRPPNPYPAASTYPNPNPNPITLTRRCSGRSSASGTSTLAPGSAV